MEIIGLIFLLVALVLIGVGLAVGLVLCAVMAGLTLAGVVSVSAAVGVWFERVGPAFRALVYQLAVLGGAASGVVLAWLGSALFEWSLPWAGLVTGGALGGAAGGLVLALIFLWTAEGLWRMAVKLVGKIRENAALPPAPKTHHPARPKLDAG